MPAEEPGKPTDADRVRPPDSSWNKTQDGSARWRVIRASDDDFAMPGESGPDGSRLEYRKPKDSPSIRPAERPPSGEELSEVEGPNPTLLDRARKKAADKGFMGDLLDVVDKGGNWTRRNAGSPHVERGERQGMTVSDDQVAAIREYLSGNQDEFRRLNGSLDRSKEGLRAYGCFITGAFFEAVTLRFNDQTSRAEVIDYVADLRSRSDNVAEELDPDRAPRRAHRGRATVRGRARLLPR